MLSDMHNGSSADGSGLALAPTTAVEDTDDNVEKTWIELIVCYCRTSLACRQEFF